MNTILCVGAAVVDFVFHLEQLPLKAEKYGTETAAIVGGGCAANAAVAIARLGGQAVLGARLGDDQIGDLVLSDLAREGVEVANVTRTQGGRSSFSSVIIDAQGERQIVNFRGAGLVLDTSWFAGLGPVAAVLTDTRRVDAAIDALIFAKSRGVPGIVDGEAPIDPAILKEASHAAFSMQGLNSLEPGADPETALRLVADVYGCWACVTDGEKGVWHTDAGQIRHTPAHQIQPVDTLAAGDVWHGAFALYLAEGHPEAEAIRFANAAAALKCMTTGGREGSPSRASVTQYLKENS